jgi:hypothetical protein
MHYIHTPHTYLTLVLTCCTIIHHAHTVTGEVQLITNIMFLTTLLLFCLPTLYPSPSSRRETYRVAQDFDTADEMRLALRRYVITHHTSQRLVFSSVTTHQHVLSFSIIHLSPTPPATHHHILSCRHSSFTSPPLLPHIITHHRPSSSISERRVQLDDRTRTWRYGTAPD